MSTTTSFSVPTFKLVDGFAIPTIAWGNGTGDAKPKAVECGVIALKTGIRHIDTAQGYHNEPESGKAIDEAQVGEKVWLTSKLSTVDGDPTKEGIALEDLRASVLSTLERLGRQPDLLLIHNPFVPPKGKLVEFWKILEQMKDAGELTASLGVSNFRPQDFEELFAADIKYKPVVNQLEYHPYVLSHLEGLLQLQAEHGIVTEAYGPLTPLLRHPTGGPIKPVLTRIAQRLSSETGKEVDATQALLLWTRAKGVVAVTASGKEENIKKIAAVQGLPDLKPEEVKEVEDLGRKVYFRHYSEHMNEDFPAPQLPEDL
ncbi:hypothetical protein JCM8547_004756 [Rhodosporidiobolus lusitaniae]